MDYTEITIETAPEGLEPLGDRLTALGAGDFAVDDGEGALAFLEENRQIWDYVDDELLNSLKGAARIRLYAADEESGRALLSLLPGALASLRADRPDVDFGSLEIKSVLADGGDWENSWKKHYRPFPVGKRLYVRPEWDALPAPEGRIVYSSDPGLAFGSGMHESTRLCMEALESAVSGGERVLDMGCGSGILSVCALLLGAGHTLGVDIDPAAARASAENARRNGVGDRAEFLSGNLLSEDSPLKITARPFEIVCANIVADVIIALAPVIYSALTPGGTLIASGIIDTRLEDTAAALEGEGLKISLIAQEADWRAILAQRPE